MGTMTDLDWSVYQAAIDHIEANLSEAEIANHEATSAAQSHITALLADTGIGVLDALIGAVSVAGELASGLIENLADTDDLVQSIFRGFAEQYPDKAMAFGNFIAVVFRGLSNLIAGELNIRIEQTRTDLVGAIAAGGDRPIDPQTLTRAIAAMPTWTQNIIGIALAAAGGFGYISAMNAGPLSATEQASMARYLPEPLSLAQLTELLKRQEIGAPFAKDQAKRLGLSPELFDLAMRLEQQRLTPDHYITLWLRTKKEAHIDEIRKLGVSEDDIERLLYLAFSEPTPSDIVRFLVRDAYDEKAVQDNKYDEDFDRKYRQDAFDRVGVSKDLAKLYWRAHWQLPSPTQGYEMLHRELITMDQLRELLKLADYAPGYVDALIGSAYLQPGRIDLRRMWEVGSITDRAELVKRYSHLGYNAADSELLADFSIRVSERTAQNAAERKRSPIAREIVRSFVQGTMSRELATQALTGIGFTPEDADAKLKEGEYGRERDRTDRIRDAVGRLYTRGQIDRDTAVSRLQYYGFFEQEISIMFDSWDIDRELRELTEAERHERDLSRSDIVSAFDLGLLTPSDAFASLTAIGYDDQEATTILELSAAKQARQEAKVEQDNIRIQYLNRRIEREEASARLDAIGTFAERRDSLLERWTTEREEKAPDLPISWLERLIFNALISEDDARAELQRRGFTDQEIDWALRLWGEEVSVARERLVQTGELAERRLEQQAQQAAARISVQERALALRERTATTAQILQQERFTQTLEQRDRLAQQKIDAAAAGRVQSAALQAERDARNLAARREQQDRAFNNQLTVLEKQIAQQDKAREDAQQNQRELEAKREQLRRDLDASTDARQVRTLQGQLDRTIRQIDAANARANAANTLRATLQERQQAFQDQQRRAREEAQRARDVEQEAARVRAESRAEGRTVRTEERGAARRTIERSQAAVQQESLRSLQLQRESLVAELNARLAALEATAAEDRIAQAEQQAAAARDALAKLVGPALAFDSPV
jgi:hypothetical protein